MTQFHVVSWYSACGAPLVVMEENGNPISPCPVFTKDVTNEDQSAGLIWPYFSGSRPQKTVFLNDLRDDRLALELPIPASIEFSDGLATACSYDLEQFGAGEDEFAALDDLRATIAELYFTLKAEAALGPLPQRQLAYLQRVLREI